MFESLEQLDRWLLLSINALHTPLLDTFMWTMSKSWHSYVFVLAVAYAVYKKYHAKKAAEFVLGCALVVACTDLSSNMVKHAVKRYRPSHNLEIKAQVHTVNDYRGGQFGFFSGHAANSFGLTTFVFLCIHWLQKKYKYLLFVYPLLICYSRMYLGVHYPSEVVTGAADGILFAIIIYSIMNNYFFKFNDKTL